MGRRKGVKNRYGYREAREPGAWFWEEMDKKEDGCWEWMRTRIPVRGNGTNNYGMVTLPGRRKELAHRVAWKLAYGEIPEGKQVCHRCDNPPCCNPEHLYLATQSENILDSSRKGRLHKMAKLTEQQVREIKRRLREDGKIGIGLELAREYGVGRDAISLIKRGKAWIGVEEQGLG